MKSKQSSYSKMYLVTPLIYNKLLNCIDEGDKKVLADLNMQSSRVQPKRPSEVLLENIATQEIIPMQETVPSIPEGEVITPSVAQSTHHERFVLPDPMMEQQEIFGAEPLQVEDIVSAPAFRKPLTTVDKPILPQDILAAPSFRQNDPTRSAPQSIVEPIGEDTVLSAPRFRSVSRAPPSAQSVAATPPVFAQDILVAPSFRQRAQSSTVPQTFVEPLGAETILSAPGFRSSGPPVRSSTEDWEDLPLTKLKSFKIPMKRRTMFKPESHTAVMNRLRRRNKLLNVLDRKVVTELTQPVIPGASITQSDQPCVPTTQGQVCGTVPPQRIAQKYTCAMCEKVFATRYNLIRHMQNIHKVNPEAVLNMDIYQDPRAAFAFSAWGENPAFEEEKNVRKRSVKGARFNDPYGSQKALKLPPTFKSWKKEDSK